MCIYSAGVQTMLHTRSLSSSNFLLTMFSRSTLGLLILLVVLPLCLASPHRRASDCTGTIASLDDIDDAVECTTVNIESFTVPAGETFEIELADGTTVNLGRCFHVSVLPQLVEP